MKLDITISREEELFEFTSSNKSFLYMNNDYHRVCEMCFRGLDLSYTYILKKLQEANLLENHHYLCCYCYLFMAGRAVDVVFMDGDMYYLLSNDFHTHRIKTQHLKNFNRELYALITKKLKYYKKIEVLRKRGL